MRICAKSLFLACRFLELDHRSVRWKDMKNFDQIDWVWKDWLVMKTAWFDSSMNSFFFPSFFMALSFSFQKDMWFWMFCSYTLTSTLLCKSHLLRHLKVTFKRVTHSRGLFATYRVLTRVTVGACTAGWALHVLIHINTI